jgi:hypothetical protein
VFDKEKTIRVNVKLFSGLDTIAGVPGPHPREGIPMHVPRGTRIRNLVKMLGLPDRHALAYFVNGERVGLGEKLRDGQEVACLKPSAGG